MADDKKEALEMVAHKIGRILNGDPDYQDSWHDIIGYTKLIEDDLQTSNIIRSTGQLDSKKHTTASNNA